MSIKNPHKGIDIGFNSPAFYAFNEGVKAAMQYLEGQCPHTLFNPLRDMGVTLRKDCPICMKQIHEELGI